MIKHAVILAGGKGTRLRPVTYEIPKPLVPVQGRPILTWQLRWFKRAGIERVTVIVPGSSIDPFGAWKRGLPSELPAVELWVEREPMGTLGALVHELSLGEGPVFVTNGDELKGLDLKTLADFHFSRKQERDDYAATVALLRVPNPSDYGVAEMNGHFISRFHEKPSDPPSDLISSGLYVIEPKTLEAFRKDDRFLMFEEVYFPKHAEAGHLGGCALEGPWYDCGTMERWERAIREWKEPA